MATTTQIFDNASSNFNYNGTWNTKGTWIARNGRNGTLSSTNDPSAIVSFVFPAPASAFRYYGMKRSHGGLYGICINGSINCDAQTASLFQSIDAFDPTDHGTSEPSLLYSRNYSTPSVHLIMLRNSIDPRGIPNGNSQLTLDRFELDVPTSDQPTMTILGPSSILSTAMQTHVHPTTVSGNEASNNSCLFTQTSAVVRSSNMPGSSRGGTTPVLVASSSKHLPSVLSMPTFTGNGSLSRAISLPSPTSVTSLAPNSTNLSVSVVAAMNASKPAAPSVIVGATLGGVIFGVLTVSIVWLQLARLARKRRISPPTEYVPTQAPTASISSDETWLVAPKDPHEGWVVSGSGSGYGMRGQLRAYTSTLPHRGNSSLVPSPTTTSVRAVEPSSPLHTVASSISHSQNLSYI